METTYIVEKQERLNDIQENAAEVIFSKLDEAIDDVRSGRVISSDELWKELSDMQGGL